MMQFTLPWPPSVLRPNRARTRHWAANGTAAALYKSVCAMALREQGAEVLGVERVAVTLEFCPPRLGKMDRSGSLAAFKAGEDALADALGIDDDNFEPITLKRGQKVAGGCVVVTVTEE